MGKLIQVNDGVPSVVSRRALEQDLAAWKEGRQQVRVQYRVRESIGWPPEKLAPLLSELETMERAIELLETELKDLPADANPSPRAAVA